MPARQIPDLSLWIRHRQSGPYLPTLSVPDIEIPLQCRDLVFQYLLELCPALHGFSQMGTAFCTKSVLCYVTLTVPERPDYIYLCFF